MLFVILISTSIWEWIKFFILLYWNSFFEFLTVLIIIENVEIGFLIMSLWLIFVSYNEEII